MTRKILLFFLFFSLVSALFSTHVSAQVTCDQCGFCQGTTKPSNWDSCAKCIYPGVTDPNLALRAKANADKAYTVFGCVETTSGGFSNFFMGFITNITSALAFLGIVYGGMKVMLARGDKDAVGEGKRYVYGSILGLVVVLFSVFIIRTVGGTLLKIPFLK